jgi:hypothetical protein
MHSLRLDANGGRLSDGGGGAMTVSGGLDELTAGESLTPTTLQDRGNVPLVMAVHGAPGSDVVIINFAEASAAWEADIATKKGFSLDCNTGEGHFSGPPQILPGMWQFMLDHPFKVSKQPYPPHTVGVPKLLPDRTSCRRWRSPVARPPTSAAACETNVRITG